MIRNGMVAVFLATAALAPFNHGQERDPDWIARRVAEIKKMETRPWSKVPWEASLLHARRVSIDERRPVFLFSYEGNLDAGRC